MAGRRTDLHKLADNQENRDARCRRSEKECVNSPRQQGCLEYVYEERRGMPREQGACNSGDGTGWTRTDVGGPQASLGIDETVPSVVSVLISERGKPGFRFLDRNGNIVP